MPTTERLVTWEDTCPSTGISAALAQPVQTSARREISLSLDTANCRHNGLTRSRPAWPAAHLHFLGCRRGAMDASCVFVSFVASCCIQIRRSTSLQESRTH
jgi:hypothetical protein